MENKEKILLASTCGLGAISIVFISLFAWKAATGGGGGGDDPGPTPSSETEIVEFFNEDGSLLKREKITKGDKVTKPEDPETEDGYFANWYTEPTFEHIYSFDTNVESDLKLYPKFAKHLLELSYDYTSATTTGEIETPTVEIAIDANPQEEVLINWGDSEDLIPITDFSKHLTHEYIEAPSSDNYVINIYGKPNAVSLSCVTDEAKPWETHLFKDDNTYFTGIELYQDMRDDSKSSSFGGLNSNNEKSSLNNLVVHDGVTFIPNHFFASSKFNTKWMLIAKGAFADTVETIGEYAFANTNLTQALIKDGVKDVKKGAFQKCANLNYVRTGRYLKSIGDNVFDDCNTTLNFYVDELCHEYDRTKECPTSFGAHNFSSITMLYYISHSETGSPNFIAKLKDGGGWPIGAPETYQNCFRMESITDLKCEHTYKISNTRYPVLQIDSPRAPNQYIFNSPITGSDTFGWISEIKCIDNPSIEISSNVLGCTTQPRILNTYFYKDTPEGEENGICFYNSDLQENHSEKLGNLYITIEPKIQ